MNDGRLIFANPLTASEGEEHDDPTILGTVIHNVIDLLPWSYPASGEPAAAASSEHLAAIVKAALRGLSPSQARRVSAETAVRRVEAFVQSDLWRELTASRRWMREIDFLLPWPLDSVHGKERAIVSGQIDCLLQNAKGELENHRLQDGQRAGRRSRRPVRPFQHPVDPLRPGRPGNDGSISRFDRDRRPA